MWWRPGGWGGGSWEGAEATEPPVGRVCSSEPAHSDGSILGDLDDHQIHQRNVSRLLGVRLFLDSDMADSLEQTRSRQTKPMLNKALRLVRIYHNLSQTEAARRIGLSKS